MGYFDDDDTDETIVPENGPIRFFEQPGMGLPTTPTTPGTPATPQNIQPRPQTQPTPTHGGTIPTRPLPPGLQPEPTPQPTTPTRPPQNTQPPTTQPTPARPATQQYGQTQITTTQTTTQDTSIDHILNKMLDMKSSDVHLTADMPPMVRVHGDITPIPGIPPLTSEQIANMMYSIMTDDQKTEYQRTHDLDLAYQIPGRSRFRVNVLQQRGKAGAVIRVIPNEIKTLQQLGMPDHLQEFARLHRGLVLVTGPTGSGKSTTLAAIIDYANRNRKDHILTIEDPIEFVHQNQGCIVTQREVGVDTASFQEGLRRALREDPDIILVGEMRDPETTAIAITAAETGHLVFGTLHTQSAAETMSRIIDQFPDGSKDQVKTQLASTIQGIVCQTLVKTLDGNGRVAAMEILKGEGSIRALIRKGQTEQIRSALETNKSRGMQTLDMHLQELVEQDRINVNEAIEKSSNAENFIQQLGGEEKVARIRRRQAQLLGTTPQNH